MNFKLFERRRFAVIILVSVFVSVCLLVTMQTNAIESLRLRIDDFKHADNKEAEKPKEEKPKEEKTKEEEDKYKPIPRPAYIDANRNEDTAEKVAYVVFLGGTENPPEDLEQDKYLQAVRILIWQLKHVPATKTKHDVVIMTAPDVSESRRKRLEKDGAIIHPVDWLHTEHDQWVTPETHRFDNVMTKLRVFEMTQYSRILMLDGDSMLRKSLDPVFDDPRAQIMKTKDVGSLKEYKPLPGEAPLPETYLLASLSEVWDSTHAFPPKEGTGLKDYGKFNAGFFMIAPSKGVLDYYKSLLDIKGSFDPLLPEQNLMNRAHNWDGPMPWRELDYKWNIRCPNENDFKNGVVSVHSKWWSQPYIYENKKVKDWLMSRRFEMKGFFEAMDKFKNTDGQ